jgi:SAM-dependent methyltransferase
VDSSYWDDKYSTDEFVYTKLENRFVVEFCSELQGETAIDLAGGEGRNSVYLAKRGWQVENIDFSQVALDKYQNYAEEENVLEKCSATCSSALDFVPKTTPVDLGVIAYLQINQADLKIAILRLASNIKPGGYLFGVWHSRDNLTGGFGGPRDPEVLPDVSTITSALEGSNLEIKVLENREGLIQTKEGLKPSVTLVLLAQVKL